MSWSPTEGKERRAAVVEFWWPALIFDGRIKERGRIGISMISKIILCTAVLSATVAVILLSLMSTPHGHHGHPKQRPSPNHIISLYIQHSPRVVDAESKIRSSQKIVVFDQPLTDGPENTSQVIGRAEGFMLSDGLFASSAFNVFNLNLNTTTYSGGLSIQGKQKHRHQAKEELPVVGGTGYFAFARGFAVFTPPNLSLSHSQPLYHVKLHLRFRR